jgi:hypothetical protein
MTDLVYDQVGLVLVKLAQTLDLEAIARRVVR